MDFQATLELHGKTATGIEVPPDVVAALGGGRKPAVVATLNGYVHRTTIGVMGGRQLIPVSADVRSGAGLAAGDTVDVHLELDTAPRTVEVPEDLAAALAAEPGARAAFDALSVSNQKRHALAVAGAKAEATRQRRVDAVLAELRG